MRPLRSTLVAVVTALAVNVVTAGSASAAPPVGCYGFPSIPDAFVCVTSFTPTNAVPSAGLGGGSTFTIPAFCAGECYGPIPVTVPGPTVSFGSGQVAVLTYKGGTYAVAVGQVPSVPPLGGSGGQCPGEPYLGLEYGPYVCQGLDYSDYPNYYWIFGTCLTSPCTVVPVPMRQLAEIVQSVYDELPPV